jgi:hypothetical protein
MFDLGSTSALAHANFERDSLGFRPRSKGGLAEENVLLRLMSELTGQHSVTAVVVVVVDSVVRPRSDVILCKNEKSWEVT